ncbi:MAG: VWA domain-containing protein [Acidobacteriota bacterium]|nr:VWA domain-containing protein [Acidobacteriota bacterium]
MTEHGRRCCLALLLGICLVAGLNAQPSDTFVETVDVQVVEVDVVVTDRKGRPVNRLTREDFELYVDGRPVEIANFYESNVFSDWTEVETHPRTPAEDEPSVRAGSVNEDALTIVFYLDDANLYLANRTRLLRRLESAVEPWRTMNAHFMLARFENRVEVVVRPTRDLNAILDGAAGRPKGLARAAQAGEAAWRFAIKSLIDSHEACTAMLSCRPCNDNWGALLSLARQYADNAATNAAIATDGLADLSTTLAGVPGKKAVVYVTDGLPQRPGISVFDYLGNQLCRDLRPSAPSEAMSEIVQYDESRRFNRLAAHANANRVTFYSLDAAGVRDASPGISLDNQALAPNFQNVNLRAMNAQSGLHMVSSETGGKALVNANDVAILLDDVSTQLAASYSLGFHAADRKPGEIRQVSVELARHAAKGRRIEYRRSYRDKSVDERLAERLLSFAYLGAAENPLRARVGFAASKALEKNVHELAVAVDVPAEAILALPFRGEEAGQLRLWLLAVREDDGARTKVRQKSLLVGGGSGVAAIDGAYRFEVAMKLPEGAYQVAVGVRDETTGVTSLVREPVSVPVPQAGAKAN